MFKCFIHQGGGGGSGGKGRGEGEWGVFLYHCFALVVRYICIRIWSKHDAFVTFNWFVVTHRPFSITPSFILYPYLYHRGLLLQYRESTNQGTLLIQRLKLLFKIIIHIWLSRWDCAPIQRSPSISPWLDRHRMTALICTDLNDTFLKWHSRPPFSVEYDSRNKPS